MDDVLRGLGTLIMHHHQPLMLRAPSGRCPLVEVVGGGAAVVAGPAEPTAKQATATSPSPCIVIVIASFGSVSFASLSSSCIVTAIAGK